MGLRNEDRDKLTIRTYFAADAARETGRQIGIATADADRYRTFDEGGMAGIDQGC